MPVTLDAVDLLVKMIVSILLPLLGGKAIRELIKPVRAVVDNFRVPIYMFTNFQISLGGALHHLPGSYTQPTDVAYEAIRASTKSLNPAPFCLSTSS